MCPGRFGREVTGPDLKSHFSVSLDYGPDMPVPEEQISFNSFKEMEPIIGGDIKAVQGVSEANEVGQTSRTYQEAVGIAASSVSLMKLLMLLL